MGKRSVFMFLRLQASEAVRTHVGLTIIPKTDFKIDSGSEFWLLLMGGCAVAVKSTNPLELTFCPRAKSLTVCLWSH